MKQIWITGAKGFIGRHVAQAFANAGWHALGIGHGSWSEVEARSYGLTTWVESEITHGSLSALCEDTGRPDAIFHAAGGSSVGQSVAHPLRDFDRTVRTTAVLLDAVRCLAPDAMMILPSSAAVYGMAGSGPISETDSLAPVSPYGVHKCMTEQLVTGARQFFGLRYAIVRYFSVYGPGLRKQLLWDLAQKLSTRPEEIVLSGTGDETRDFLHVQDAARFAVTLVDKVATLNALTVNGGSGSSVTVRHVAETLGHLLSPETRIRFNGTPRAGDPLHYQSDTRLMSSAGFRPAQGLDNGLVGYADWFMRAEDGQRKCA